MTRNRDEWYYKVILGALMLLILAIFSFATINLYNCSKVDEVIALKKTIRKVGLYYPCQHNVNVIDSAINDLEKRDYFHTISGDIVELRRRNNEIKQIYGFE